MKMNMMKVQPTFSQVRVDGHVSGSTGQALMLPVWNVFFCLWVDVFFGQAKVNDVDDVVLFVPLPADEKVLRFDVSVNEVFRVHILHPRDLAPPERTDTKQSDMSDQAIASSTTEQTLFYMLY